MIDLANFPITKKWPAQHPDRIELYSLPTPNGVKISIMLEESGLPYDVRLVNKAGRSCVVKNVTVSAGGRYAFSIGDAELKACRA